MVKAGVNALQRATIISTVNVDGTPEAAVVCQCPSTGNHHFYKIDDTETRMIGVCQCPSTGNHHFYITTGGGKTMVPTWCQCPSTGNHHFYFNYYEDEDQTLVSVNALQRATIISTLLISR